MLNPHKCVLIKFARVPVSVRREKDWHLQYLKTKLWSQSHLCIQAQFNFLSEITNFVQNKINCLQVYIVIRVVYMYMLYTKTRLNRRIADRNRQYGCRRYKKEWVLVVTTLLKSFKFSFSWHAFLQCSLEIFSQKVKYVLLLESLTQGTFLFLKVKLKRKMNPSLP